MAIIYQLITSSNFMKSIYILTLILSISCSFEKKQDDLRVLLKTFDNRYMNVINGLCDSLSKNIGKNSSFDMEYRPKQHDVYFSYIDSSNRGKGYFTPKFDINRLQEDFFNKAIVGDVIYDKTTDIFSMKLFVFKEYDKTVWLYIYPRQSEKNIIVKDSMLYRSQNRLYTWGEAW